MHSYAHGLGGKHIWPILNKYVVEGGCEIIKTIDERYFELLCIILNFSSHYKGDLEQQLCLDGEDYITLTT